MILKISEKRVRAGHVTPKLAQSTCTEGYIYIYTENILASLQRPVIAIKRLKKNLAEILTFTTAFQFTKQLS